MKRLFDLVETFKKNVWSKILRVIQRKSKKRSVKNYRVYQKLVHNKVGLEIGGPSRFFKRELPIYHKMKSLDGVNFSISTIWEGKLSEGQNYQYGKKGVGYQFICDAVDLSQIPSGKYDFLLSCNSLEHIANPFKALTEWLRVLKTDGSLILVLPNKESNFDRHREITTFEHLLEDFENNTGEDDLTHLNEILAQHDISMDTPAGTFEDLKKRSLDNFNKRCLHHHVFDIPLLERIMEHFKVEVLVKNTIPTDFVIAGRKRIF